LQRPDALLAWHADSHGRVLDRQSAADADVLAAYALLRYRGPDASALSAAGQRLAGAVWRHETVTVNRRRVLVAGPWAAGSHPTFNPSYWMPSVFRWIGAETSDSRWRRLATTSVALLSQLSQNGNRLPPDWAHVVAGRMVPMNTPGTNQSPRYGLEAERSPAWLAADCAASARSLAAKWSRIIGGDSTASASLSRGLHGRVFDSTRMPLPMAGAAAAAAAAGHDDQSNQLLESAVSQEQQYPTYYGAAWVALGAALINGHPPACASSGGAARRSG
jgi:endoglucanase